MRRRGSMPFHWRKFFEGLASPHSSMFCFDCSPNTDKTLEHLQSIGATYVVTESYLASTVCARKDSEYDVCVCMH